MSGVSTLSLADFLLARIAEDEEAARAFIPDADKWGTLSGEWVVEQATRGKQVRALSGASVARGSEAVVAHAARHDPARVLAECAAKRRIVELHQHWQRHADALGAEPALSERFVAGHESGLGLALEVMASVYADHPDYRQEWTP